MWCSWLIGLMLICLLPPILWGSLPPEPLQLSFHECSEIGQRRGAPSRQRCARAQLAGAWVFSGPYIGPNTDRVTAEARAFRYLLRHSPAPRAQFRALLHQPNPVGQLYGLAGLYLVDRALFLQVLERYAQRQDLIPTLDGCLSDSAPMGELVWQKRPPVKRGDAYDIASGCSPSLLSRPCPLEHLR